MAEPKIYTKNYVFSDCVFTSSHGDTFMNRIYDRDRDSQWISSGADDDSTEVTLQVDFYEGGVVQTRTINRIILINHNLKDPTIEHWDGSDWQTFDTGSALATSHNIFTNDGVSVTKIRIRCSTTQVADAEKAIGELIACNTNIDFSQDVTSYQPLGVSTETNIKLADGSNHRTVIKHTLNRSIKYEATFTFMYLTTAEVDELRQLKESGASFLFHPESSQRIDEIYYVNWIGQFKPKYVSPYKGAGYQFDMQVREI